nr:hypothetical protein [Deinococcus radiophilus]
MHDVQHIQHRDVWAQLPTDTGAQMPQGRGTDQAGPRWDVQLPAQWRQEVGHVLHHQGMFVAVLGAAQQGLSRLRVLLGVPLAAAGAGEGLKTELSALDPDQQFRTGPGPESTIRQRKREDIRAGVGAAQVGM